MLSLQIRLILHRHAGYICSKHVYKSSSNVHVLFNGCCGSVSSSWSIAMEPACVDKSNPRQLAPNNVALHEPIDGT